MRVVLLIGDTELETEAMEGPPGVFRCALEINGVPMALDLIAVRPCASHGRPRQVGVSDEADEALDDVRQLAGTKQGSLMTIRFGSRDMVLSVYPEVAR